MGKNFLADFSYTYQNVGEFRSIMVETGYTEEYNSGALLYTKGDIEIKLTFGDIREKASAPESVQKLISRSHERLASFVDAQRVAQDFASYRTELRSNHDTSILMTPKGRMVIDHESKVAYPWSALFQYARENGIILDGQGTRLEEGQYSALGDIEGQQGKYYRGSGGLRKVYAREALVIPDEILSYKLPDADKDKLKRGEIIAIPAGKKKTIYLQVDKELNAVIILSNKEIQVPDIIGNNPRYQYDGHVLSNADKTLLANGYKTDAKLLCGQDGFMLAELQLTEDKRGIMFINVRTLSREQAQEWIAKHQEQGIDHEQELQEVAQEKSEPQQLVEDTQSPVKDVEQLEEATRSPKEEAQQLVEGTQSPAGEVQQPMDNKEKEHEEKLFEAIKNDDFIEVNNLKKEGYVPSKETLAKITADPDISENKKIAINKIFEISPDEQKARGIVVKDEKKHQSQKADKMQAVSGVLNKLFAE